MAQKLRRAAVSPPPPTGAVPMKRWAFVVIATAAIAGCTERQVLQSPPIGRPVALILDGAHDGDPDFFFLPPLVGSPVNDPHFDAGKFDATLTPTVEVDRKSTRLNSSHIE